MYRTTDNKKVSLARKRLYELILKSIGQIPILEEPSQEQKKWVKTMMGGYRFDVEDNIK